MEGGVIRMLVAWLGILDGCWMEWALRGNLRGCGMRFRRLMSRFGGEAR